MLITKFLARPSLFKNRPIISQKQVKFISLNNGLYSFIVNNHNCEVQVLANQHVKFHCDCESFKYHHSSLLKTKNSLIYPDEFSNTIPKQILVPWICKHLEACVKFIYNRRKKSND